MRPTGIGYVSPRERTPAHYTTYVSQKKCPQAYPIPHITDNVIEYFCTDELKM